MHTDHRIRLFLCKVRVSRLPERMPRAGNVFSLSSSHLAAVVGGRASRNFFGAHPRCCSHLLVPWTSPRAGGGATAIGFVSVCWCGVGWGEWLARIRLDVFNHAASGERCWRHVIGGRAPSFDNNITFSVVADVSVDGVLWQSLCNGSALAAKLRGFRHIFRSS